MADAKLSALATATAVDWLYGEVGGASKKIAPANVGSSGLVTLPGYPLPVIAQPFVDVLLPSGYAPPFYLSICDLILSANDYFGFSLSADGGTTWHSDTTFFSAYNGGVGMNNFESNSIGLFVHVDNAAGSREMVAGKPALIEAAIYPGASDQIALISSHTTYKNIIGAFSVVPAINAPAIADGSGDDLVGAWNAIRLLPYGNGDCDPPTSGHTFSGTISVRAEPT